MIEGYFRRDINVDTDQKYRENVGADANMFFQLKQRDQLNEGHDNMAIPYVEEFFMCLSTLS